MRYSSARPISTSSCASPGTRIEGHLGSEATSTGSRAPRQAVLDVGRPAGKATAVAESYTCGRWRSHRRAIVHVFGEHADLKFDNATISWSPPEDIQDRSEIRVVLCKTAITTGWDCPRAEVLVSLRVARDADTITQVMGRMVRTPLARRIHTYEDLNAVHCILPKFDQEAVDAIAEKFRTGDADSVSGGTTVITKPSSLAWNPSFT